MAGLMGLLRDRGAVDREHGGRIHDVARVKGSLDAALNVDMHLAVLLDDVSANKEERSKCQDSVSASSVGTRQARPKPDRHMTHSILPTPTPCSPETVPPRRIARLRDCKIMNR